MREAAKPALEKLDELGIKYYYYEHPLAKTMEDCEGIGADVGAKHFKNIYACDHTETNFFIIIIRADKKFRTSEVSRKLGVSRLSFCTDEMLQENLGVVSGAVTPLALMNDKEHKTLLVVDKDILRDEMVCCHPLTSDASVAMHRYDLIKFVRACGNEIKFLDIGETEQAAEYHRHGYKKSGLEPLFLSFTGFSSRKKH